jgi:hypothetical protein
MAYRITGGEMWIFNLKNELLRRLRTAYENIKATTLKY